MIRLRGMLSLLLVGGLLAGCDDDPTEPEPEDDEFEWIATLQGLEGWQHLSGEAGFVWLEGTAQFTAAASISGDEPGAVRPWHVHHNTCAEGGGIVGADGDYPRLTVGEDGTATATATVPIPVDLTASYHVNVHLSEEEMGTVLACGDLNLLGGG